MTDVLGFLVQCEVCPQQAIVAEQPSGWVCPRCAEMGGFGDVDVLAGEPLTEMAAADARLVAKLDAMRGGFSVNRPHIGASALSAFVVDDGDGPDLGKIRG